MTAKSEPMPLDWSSALAACGKAWLIASLLVPIGVVLVTIFERSGSSGSNTGGSLIAGAFVLYPLVAIGAAIVSFPFMLLIAAPCALVLARWFGPFTPINMIVGVVLGFATAFAAQRLGFALAFRPMVFGPLYGAFTGLYVTRMIYA